MRVLVLPIISSKFVPAAPSLNFVRALVTNVLAKYPEAVFYVVLPEASEGSGWEYGEEVVLPRTHVIKLPMYRSQFDDLYLSTREFWQRFNERKGDLFFDVILNERPALSPMLKRLSSFHVVSKSWRPTVVNRNQIVMNKKWFAIDENDEMMEAMGELVAPTIFQSPHQREVAFQIARKYLRAAQMERLMAQSRVFPLGIDCADVDATNMEERSQKHEKVTVNYSHKLFLEQKFVESLKIMDSAFAGGRPIELQIVTGSAEGKMYMLKKALPYQYIRIVGRASRQVFLKEMAKAHVFVSNSTYEDFSATVVEQMYSGLIPVLIDKPWARYLVPEGYPYLFGDPTEGGAMLRYVCDNWQAVADEWVPKMRAKIKAEFDLADIAVDMYEWMVERREIDRAKQKVGGGMRDVIEKVWPELPDTFDIGDIARVVRREAENMDLMKEAESKSVSKFLFVDALLQTFRGQWVDLGEEQPSWRKTGAS